MHVNIGPLIVLTATREAGVKLEAPENVLGKTINVACGRSHSLPEFVTMLEELLGIKIKRVFKELRPGDDQRSLVGISLTREFLGYNQSVDFHEGLNWTIAW